MLENPIYVLSFEPYVNDLCVVNPAQYIVGCADNYKVYLINIDYYYQSDLEDGSTIRDNLQSDDSLIFIGKTDNPIEELKQRIAWFYNLFKDDKQFIQWVITGGCHGWIEPLDRINAFYNALHFIIDCPKSYPECKYYTEDLEYKFRKMYEYITSIAQYSEGALLEQLLGFEIDL